MSLLDSVELIGSIGARVFIWMELETKFLVCSFYCKWVVIAGYTKNFIMIGPSLLYFQAYPQQFLSREIKSKNNTEVSRSHIYQKTTTYDITTKSLKKIFTSTVHGQTGVGTFCTQQLPRGTARATTRSEK